MCYDKDGSCPTLEPQLLKANSLSQLNRILGKEYKSEDELKAYMKGHKTECALRFFEAKENWTVPEYISRAIQ